MYRWFAKVPAATSFLGSIMDPVPVFLKSWITRDDCGYLALEVFYPELCSFCSTIWRLQIHPSIWQSYKITPSSHLCSRDQGAKCRMLFLYLYSQLCSDYSRGLAGSLPGFCLPHLQNNTLMIVSEACFKVKDILGKWERLCLSFFGGEF